MLSKPTIFEWTIHGRVASKKNGWKPIVRGKRVMMVPSNAWNKFEKDALKQLELAKDFGLKPPYSAQYRFELRGKGNIDLDNLVAGINDVLEKAGIIENDRQILHIQAEKVLNCEEYLTWISISGRK